jgi:hypothetical protein
VGGLGPPSTSLFHGCPWHNNACVAAAYAGHVRVLDWAVANGCLALDETLFAAAAAGGNVETLEWAAAHRCPWDMDACTLAAREGELRSLKWLRARGCPWNTMVCVYAAARGDLEMLKWARENGCDWDENTFRAAFYEGGPGVVAWVVENGCPVPPELQAANSGPTGDDTDSNPDESPLLEAVTALMRRSLTAHVVLGSDSDEPDEQADAPPKDRTAVAARPEWRGCSSPPKTMNTPPEDGPDV